MVEWVAYNFPSERHSVPFESYNKRKGKSDNLCCSQVERKPRYC